MRIGIDCRLPAYQMGGISQYVIHLVAALGEIDGDNQYTVFHSRKDKRRYLPKRPNFRRATLWTPCHHRWERWVVAAEVRPHGLDVLHSPDFIPPAFGARRRIITVHDLNFLYYPHFLTAESRRYYLEQIAWAVQAADRIASDSEHTRQELIERLNVPPEKVTAIPLAANPIFSRPQSEADVRATLARYNLTGGFILFVGTLEPRKNVPLLLRAYACLRQEAGPDAPLVLAGRKGWLYEEIFATIDALHLSASVRHLEGVHDDQLACLYQAAGVLALPSYYEGFGLPLLEAMHCGCPVISSNRGSLPEVGGPAAILLDPDDVNAWAEAIHRVLHDSALRQQMAAAGLAQAGRFTWRQTAAETLKLYLAAGR